MFYGGLLLCQRFVESSVLIVQRVYRRFLLLILGLYLAYGGLLLLQLGVQGVQVFGVLGVGDSGPFLLHLVELNIDLLQLCSGGFGFGSGSGQPRLIVGVGTLRCSRLLRGEAIPHLVPHGEELLVVSRQALDFLVLLVQRARQRLIPGRQFVILFAQGHFLVEILDGLLGLFGGRRGLLETFAQLQLFTRCAGDLLVQRGEVSGGFRDVRFQCPQVGFGLFTVDADTDYDFVLCHLSLS